VKAMILATQCVKGITTPLILIMLVMFAVFQSPDLAANNHIYHLEELSQLSHRGSRDQNWQQILANPSNKEQSFIFNSTGQLYLLEDTIAAKPSLDLKNDFRLVDLPKDKLTDSSIIKFSALALHPNFSLRKQVGYGTFYTAHVEAANVNSKTRRLVERSADIALIYDAVITQWQFNTVNHKQVDLNSQREVMRIAVPDDSFAIEQMSFNPAHKSWNDDFGLLYISLSSDKKWQQPLYSGVVLRINPAKFGLRSFTIPSNNPFLNVTEIEDAIFLLGGQKIKQFLWPDKNRDQLLLLHHYEKQDILSFGVAGDNWQAQAPMKIVHQSESAITGLIQYRGRNLASLRNKLLLLKQIKRLWSIESIAITDLDAKQINTPTPQRVWQFTAEQLPKSSQPTLTTNLSKEVLLIEHTENLLYQFTQDDTEKKVSKLDVEVDASSTSNTVVFVFILSIIAAAVYYVAKRKKFSARSVLRQKYSAIELSESTQQLELYRNQQQHAETIIDLANITRCEILLNDYSLTLINNEAGHGFTQDKETELRALCNKEHIDKMVNGKVRQINLEITDRQNNNYVVCLYLRKGSNRITKRKYFKVVDDVIDWCWLIAQQINPEQTGKRTVNAAVSAAEETGKQPESNIPLHHQAAAIRSVAKVKSQSKTNAITKAQADSKPEQKDVSTAQQETAPKTVDNDRSVDVFENNKVDSELVNALEKLVKLKQQGFLTEEEFSQAKAALLKSLFNK